MNYLSTNPCPMPPVNNESLTKDSVIAKDYHNSRLGDFLKELHLTEGRSTGIPKIRRFMKNNGSPEPVFETDADNGYFLTILSLHKDYIQEDYNNSGVESGVESDMTTQIIAFLKTQPLSKSEIAKQLGKNKPTRYLNELISKLLKEKIVEYTIPENPQSRLQKYRLTKTGYNLLTNP